MGAPLRRGAVFLEPTAPSEKRLRALAHLLTGDDTTDGLDRVTIDRDNGSLSYRRLGRSRHRMMAWLAAGGAPATVAAGVALVAINGRCTASPVGDDALCQRVYDTRTAGQAAIGAGAAIGAVAAYLFFRHGSKEHPLAAIMPTSGGAMVTWGRGF